ncbi:MAG TPA: Ig-like domain-containing protein, partial [Chryseosolibacter sp.]|nr:Ig-like domain-containing protein [Chryseosolibacter sp.]
MKHHPTAGLRACHKPIFAIAFLLTFFLGVNLSYAQTPGLIFKKASTSVLDPNSDGYTSVSSSGFVTDDHTESEIPYRPLVVPSVEPVADPGPGPDCGFTDIVDSGDEDPVFSYVDASGNFLFRFRIGRSADNSKGYSVMIDTDQKFGFTGVDADANAVAGNPGFEMEIILESNFGVSLYDVDGTTTPVQKGTTLPWESHAQKSIALTTNCGDADYFYDFYIPWSTITTYFPGVDQNTPIRMLAVTTMNPNPAIGNGAVSDAGGIDDKAAGYNYDQIFQTVINNYTPTPATGTPVDRTPCPIVNGGVNNGATTVTGTSTAIGATIYVYKGTTTLTQINSATVTVQADGTWTATVPAVTTGDVISAKAQAAGKGLSTNACSQITVTNCSPPAPPYVLTVGSGKKLIEGTGTVGALLNVYTFSAGSYVAAGGSITVPSGGSWCWRANNTGVSDCSTSGASDLTLTTYYVSQTVNGCESAKVPVCVANNNISTNPTLAQTSISTSTTTLSGTSGNNASVTIYANSTVIGTATASGSSWTATVNLSAHGGKYVWVQAIESGKCVAIALSSAVLITVPTPTSTTPVVTGSYCGTAAGTLQAVTGTSTEADGTVITTYINGISTGTTTVYNGTWAIALTLKSNDKVRATATASGENVSGLSNEITVSLSGGAPVVSFDPMVEGSTTVSGTFSGGTTLNIYVDGALLASTTSSPFNLTVGIYEIYAGASVTATVTSGGCESAHSTAVTVPCLTPSASVSIDAATLSSNICSGSTTNVILTNPEENIIYQLFDGGTASGVARLGPASGTLTLTSAALTDDATLTVKALKISAVSCTAILTATHAVTITTTITNNTITAPTTSTFCQSGDPDAIAGSDPAGGNGAYTYQWMTSTDNVTYTNVSGATEKSYNPGTITSTTYYKRVVTSGPCQTTTSSPVILTIQNTSLTNTISSSVSTTMTDSGIPEMTGNDGGVGITYVWQMSSDNTTWGSTGITSQNYAPGTGINSTTYFRRLATNGACSSTSNVITYAVNHTPSVTSFSIGATEDTELLFAANDFTSNFTDADGDALAQIRIESISSDGVLHIGGSALSVGSVIAAADFANLRFIPSSNFEGSTSFTWKGFDGNVYSSATSTVTINVTGANDAPTAASKTVSTSEDVAYEFSTADFTVSYADVDGDAFAGIKVTSLPASGVLQLGGVDVTTNQVIAVADIDDLTFASVANENGTSYTTFNFQVSDGTDYSGNYAMTVDVTSVNDTPSFTKGLDQTVSEDAGAQTETGWATTISAGPANENTQTLTFNVSNDNNSLFSTQPAISATGELTYTPAANAFGSATATVTL